MAGLAAIVAATDGLRLMAEPEASVVAFRSDDLALDLFVLADELAARGWHTQPQMAYGQLPVSIHLSVTASVAPRVLEFADVLTDAVAAARATGPALVPPEIVTMASMLTPDQLTSEMVEGLASSLGLGGEDAHPPMAPVNAILNIAPAPLREKLLMEFLSLLQRP